MTLYCFLQVYLFHIRRFSLDRESDLTTLSPRVSLILQGALAGLSPSTPDNYYGALPEPISCNLYMEFAGLVLGL